MTTRNTEHAKVLASIASQVVEMHRARRPTTQPRTATVLNPEPNSSGIDPSWQWTLNERFQG